MKTLEQINAELNVLCLSQHQFNRSISTNTLSLREIRAELQKLEAQRTIAIAYGGVFPELQDLGITTDQENKHDNNTDMA